MMNADRLTLQNQNSYTLLHALGEGAIARVHRARADATGKDVAIKIMREGLPDRMCEFFWREVEVLGELARAEAETGDGIQSIPRVLDMQRDGRVQCFVMELVEGHSLGRVLERQQSLAETQALGIAGQFLRVLDLLHTRMGRAYTDMRLENIYLVGDAAQPTIKVLDWGTVSETFHAGGNKALVQADLMRFGAYLYRMLTGQGALETGEPEQALMARTGKPRWDEISLGTRQLLAHALAPQAAKRFESAAAFRAAVQAQAHAWDIEWVDHLGDARELLTYAAFDDDARNRIEIALDMAERLGGEPKKIEIYRRQLQERAHPVSEAWKKGKAYMAAEMYGEAANVLRAAAEEKQDAIFWRQALLAQAGTELGEAEYRNTCAEWEQLVAHLNSSALGDAHKLAQDLQTRDVTSPSLALLVRETQARVALTRADVFAASQDVRLWEQAVEMIQRAQAVLDALPYGKLIQPLEPDLTTRVESLEQKIKTRRNSVNAENKIAALLRANETFAQGLAELQAALLHDPQNLTLAQIALEYAQYWRKAGEPERALTVLETTLEFGHAPTMRTTLLAVREKVLGAIEYKKSEPARQIEREMAREERARLETERRQAELQAERAESGHLAAERAKDERRKQEQHAMELKALEQEKVREQERLAAQARQQEELRQVELRAEHAELERARQHRAELERLAQEKWNQQRQYLIPQAQTALANGDYLGVRELVTQAPQEDFYANKGWHPLFFELQRHFDEVARRQVVPQLHLLLQILNYMEPNASRVEVRQKRYDEVVNKIDADTDKWANATLRWLDEQSQKKKPEEYGALIVEVDRVLPLVSTPRMQEHYKVFRAMLERRMSARNAQIPTASNLQRELDIAREMNAADRAKHKQEREGLEQQVEFLKRKLDTSQFAQDSSSTTSQALTEMQYTLEEKLAAKERVWSELESQLRNRIWEKEQELVNLNATDQQVSQDLELKDQRIKALELDLELRDQEIEMLSRQKESKRVGGVRIGLGYSKDVYPLTQGPLESLIGNTFSMLIVLNAKNVDQVEVHLREILSEQKNFFTPDIQTAVIGGIALAQLLKIDFRGAEIYELLKQSKDVLLKEHLPQARTYFEEKALIYWQGAATKKYQTAKSEMGQNAPNLESALKHYISAYITSVALEIVFQSDWERYFKNNKLVPRPDLRQSGVLTVSLEEIKKIRKK